MTEKTATVKTPKSKGFIGKFLDTIEKVGNKLPDPAILFLVLMLTVWVLSALMSNYSFAEIDPRTKAPIIIQNMMTGTAFANFFSSMVTVFTGFAPLGIVLVACWVLALQSIPVLLMQG